MAFHGENRFHRGSFHNNNRGDFNRPNKEGLTITISSERDRQRRSRSPGWRNNRGRGGFNNDSRRSDPRNDSCGHSNWRDDDRRNHDGENRNHDFYNTFPEERHDSRLSRNENHFRENDREFRHKRKFSADRYLDYKDSFERRDFKKFDNSGVSREHSPNPKRPHFEVRGRGRGGFGFRGRGFRTRPFERGFTRSDGYFKPQRTSNTFDNDNREHRPFRDGKDPPTRSRSLTRTFARRTRNFSGSPKDSRDSNKKSISEFISNIRNKTSPKDSKDKNDLLPSKEEQDIETQVIDEKLYETMTLDQRDYVASKALRILVTKPETRCKLSELEYELMDIKIMFVSSELFLEFLQSFIDDDNVFEIIEPKIEPSTAEEEEATSQVETVSVKQEFADVKVKKETPAEENETTDKTEDEKDKTEDEKDKTEDEKDKTEDEKDETEKESSHLENIIIVGHPKFEFCSKYTINIHSCGIGCGALHICKFHILSKCNAPEGKRCVFAHSFNTEHNREALRYNLLHTFTLDMIKAALKQLKFRNPSTLPPICWYYNTNKGCNKWKGGTCPFLHMCENLLKGETCEKEKSCALNHDLQLNSDVLTRFGMWSPAYRLEDLLKVISDNFIAYDYYARKYPDQDKDKDDYYAKAGLPKPKWQLFIPSDEMWMDLTETCHKELEGRHRAVVRAKAAYEETLDEMKQFKVTTLIGSEKEVPEICNKILRRLEPEVHKSAEKSDENDKEVKEEEKKE